jgi:GT2 family glycosyltransferase
VTVVFGDCYMVDETGHILDTFNAEDESFHRKLQFWRGWRIPQPTVFVRRSVWEEVGPLDESLCYAFDYEWFLRIAKKHRFVHLGRVMARYRLHTASKSGTDWELSRRRFYPECFQVSRRYWGTWPQIRYWQYRGGYLLSPLRRQVGGWKANITRWWRMRLPKHRDQE